MSPPPLSHEEHLEVLACIEEIHRCRSLAAFAEHVLRALAPLIPSNLSAFNELNVARKRLGVVMSRRVPDEDRLRGVWERHSGQHPIIRYALETGDGQAMMISDFLSADEFHRLEIYREMYRLVDAEDQLSVVLRTDKGVMIALAFNRDRRDFTERERVKLNLVRPHILQAYANAEELAGRLDEKRDLQTALRETGHGLIAVDDGGSVAHATPGAPECVTRFFRGAESAEILPGPLTEWLASDPHTPFTLHAGDATLIVRSPRHTARRLLLLSETRHRRLPGERLTPREIEVLRWIAEGKSNAEIATILGMSPGTAKQHVQNILAKLGVANRTAAAALAREYGLILS